MTRWVPLFAALFALGCDGEPEDPEPPQGATTGAEVDPSGKTTGEGGEEDSGEGSSSGGGVEDSGESGSMDEGGSESGASGCGLSHAADIQPIWDAHCTAECHEPGGSWMSVMLTDTFAYTSLVDRDGSQTSLYEELKLVIPGDVENSYLVHKLRDLQGESVGGLGGVAMPAVEVEGSFEAGPLLPEADIQLVEDWIDCGAPE